MGKRLTLGISRLVLLGPFSEIGRNGAKIINLRVVIRAKRMSGYGLRNLASSWKSIKINVKTATEPIKNNCLILRPLSKPMNRSSKVWLVGN